MAWDGQLDRVWIESSIECCVLGIGMEMEMEMEMDMDISCMSCIGIKWLGNCK